MKKQLRRLKPGKLIFIGLLSLVLASASVSWAQIVVTTLADSGPGSLRQAIFDGNAWNSVLGSNLELDSAEKPLRIFFFSWVSVVFG